MIQLNPQILGNLLHLHLHLILHTAPKAKNLSDLRSVENNIAAQHNEFENQMPSPILEFLRISEGWVVDETAGCPVASYFDAVDGGTEELVIALYDAEVAAYEDELFGPFRFVAEHLADAPAHFLLHFEMAFLELFACEALFDFVGGEVVAACVGAQESGGGEDVGVVYAPGFYYLVEGSVVECHEAFPEEGVLVAEFGLHVDVEAVVYEDELGAAGGETSDEDVAWVGVAVDPAPEEHLGGEEIDHFCHDGF